MKLKSFIAVTLIGFTLLLTSCSFFRVQKMDIEQGNILDPAKVRMIKLGMTREHVMEILGTPVLTNPFQINRMDYVYRIQPGYGIGQEQRFTLFLLNDRVVKIMPMHLRIMPQ